MYMIGHHDCGVQFIAFSVVVQAVLEDCIAGFWWERGSIVLAESYEERTAMLLIVGEIAA